MIELKEIMKILPHRYPFLLADRILDINYNESVVGIKNVTANEAWAQGHFPGEPIFPGVLILETMAQIGGFMFCDMKKDLEPLMSVLSKIDKVKFVKQVVPGDTIVVKGQFKESLGNFKKVKCIAYVNEKKVCEALITYCFK